MDYNNGNLDDIQKSPLTLILALLGLYHLITLILVTYKIFTRALLKHLSYSTQPLCRDVVSVLVTGSTNGIGLCLAEELARNGKQVIIHGRNQKLLNETKQRIATERNNKPQTLNLDLSKIRTVEEYCNILDNVFSTVVSPEMIINNAGYSLKWRFIATDYNEAIESYNTNIISLICITNAYMKSRISKSPKISNCVFISSGLSKIPIPYYNCYPFSKHIGNVYYSMIDSIAKRDHLTVNALYICVGWVITKNNIIMYKDYNEQLEKIANYRPKFPVLLPEASAKAILNTGFDSVESYGHPYHYIASAVGEFVYKIIGAKVFKIVLKKKLQYLLDMEKNINNKQEIISGGS